MSNLHHNRSIFLVELISLNIDFMYYRRRSPAGFLPYPCEQAMPNALQSSAYNPKLVQPQKSKAQSSKARGYKVVTFLISVGVSFPSQIRFFGPVVCGFCFSKMSYNGSPQDHHQDVFQYGYPGHGYHYISGKNPFLCPVHFCVNK